MTISYKPSKWREYAGEYKAVISEVEVVPNKNFNPEFENSTEETLTITFLLEDPETLENTPFVQRYVAPLTNGKGVFQQILDCMELLPDAEGGEFDEQSMIGTELIIEIAKSKPNKDGKQYDNVVSAKKGAKKGPAKTVRQIVKKDEDGDLEF